MTKLRLRFWLAASDVAAWLRRMADKLYLWTIARASDCVDWSEP